MNYLLAKLRSRTSEFVKVIASKNEILEAPDLTNTEDYSPGYNLDPEEWFKLDNFLARGYENGLIENTFSGTTFNQITTDKYKDIKYLCCKQNNLYLFQKMSMNQLLSKKWFRITDSPLLQRDKPIIVINEWIDAVYNKDNDTLYFKDIVKIKEMFKKIEDLYRIASQVEVNRFLDMDFISLGTDFTSDSVKVANRRRIAIALKTLNNFNAGEVIEIFEYTKSYCTSIFTKDDTFVIDTEEHLKLVLFGIEQRYYTTSIGDAKKRLANSILEILDND